MPRCARHVPASKPIDTSLLLYKIVHPPVPTARTLKPTLTARHHLEQHDPRPSRLSAPKITQTCGPVSSRQSTRPILWHVRLPHNNQKAYVHIYRARLGHVSIPPPALALSSAAHIPSNLSRGEFTALHTLRSALEDGTATHIPLPADKDRAYTLVSQFPALSTLLQRLTQWVGAVS